MNRYCRTALLSGLLGVLSSGAHAGFTLTTIPADQWGAADSVLGVAGYTIEDFEDASLIAGLQIGWSASVGTIAPSGTLPRTFDPRPIALGGDDAFGSAFFTHPCGSSACSSIWDGAKVLVSGFGNISYGYSGASQNWGDVDIVFTTPVKSVGFSLQQNEFEVDFRLNGAGPTLTVGGAPGGGRYGYLRIDATAGDVISSIKLDNVNGDAFIVDHLAVQAVPEPETYALMLAGLGLVAWGARRRMR